ncbi:hypothetical protein BpHYR1_048200 [Brachionus plicatilis]|uniref:Uncharacterized protein n=1 Tax=Brachionus plicatilis TaxID=10195 RepID=A0A3M7RU91_BRAPC|nr:hypothetical protein BpHYR1_048200 [Brachionus plicatilis]
MNSGAKSVHSLKEFTLMISFSLMRAGKDITQAPKLGRPKSDTNDSINGPRSYNRTRISEYQKKKI